MTEAGENKAWEMLAACTPEEVCQRAGVSYDPAGGLYHLRSFGRSFTLDPAARRIVAPGAEGDLFLKRLAYFFRLAVIWYLVKAVDEQPSGTLVKPASLSGGELFFKGSHVLPLDALAKKYAVDRAGFLAAAAGMGGDPAGYGDAAATLHPLPKVPVTLILWTADDEFPARADLLFDATARRHLPLDLLWSVSMMSTLVFL